MLLFHIFNTETIDRSIVFKTIDCRFAPVNSQRLRDNNLAIPSYPVNRYYSIVINWSNRKDYCNWPNMEDYCNWPNRKDYCN